MLRDDFHPSYSLYKSKACDWLVTRIRKEITSKKYIRKDLKWSRQKQRRIRTTHGLVRIWKVLCEFCTTWRCCTNFKVLCEFRTSLEQLSSEGHIFLISAPNHTWFKALDSTLPELWNGISNVENGLREVLQNCERRLKLLSSVFFTLLVFPLCFTPLLDLS